MAEQPTTEPLVGAPERQASDSLRGYDYQIWRSVLAWLKLKDDEVVFLEGAEDFEIGAGDKAEAAQVKDTAGSGPISLNTLRATTALENYLEIKEKNEDRKIRYRYLTTSTSCVEQSAPFGKGAKGIDVWARCQKASSFSGVAGDVQKIIDVLKGKTDAGSRLAVMLDGNSSDAIWTELIKPFEWATGEPGTGAIKSAIAEILVVHGEKRDVGSQESRDVMAHLFRRAAPAFHRLLAWREG